MVVCERLSRHSGNSGNQVDNDPVVSQGTDVVQVFNVHLDAGQYYMLKSIYNFLDDGNVFLLSSDPGNSATWRRGRFGVAGAPEQHRDVSGGCTRILAARAGWHGLVIAFDDHRGGTTRGRSMTSRRPRSARGTFCDQVGHF